MANIYIEYDYFSEGIKAIEAYKNAHIARMGLIDRCITNLNSSWQGPDYDALKQKWLEMNNCDSTSEEMLRDLEAYADKLSYAAKMYISAQQNAITRASKLRRY